MATRRRFRGDPVNHDSPNWGPLEALIGRYLARHFMWMSEVELRNRTRLHAYKHRSTRAYFHLTRDGRCFAYEDGGFYRQISQYQAIVAVFCLRDIHDPERDPMRLYTPREQALLLFSWDHASDDLLDAGDPSTLLAGPGRFEPLYPPPPDWDEDGPASELDQEIPF